MRKRSRKIIVTSFITLLFVSLFFTACINSEASDGEYQNPYNLKVKEATNDFYVNDFANLFTDEQKENMILNAEKLEADFGGIQVVLTTVNSLSESVEGVTDNGQNQITIENVAYSMYNQYGIGEDSMGILVLFSVGDREVKIETGYTMQMYITDSKSIQILDDYGMDYFVENQFAEGLIAVQEAIIEEIKTIVPQDWNSSSDASLNDNVETKKDIETIKSGEKKSSRKGILAILFSLTGMGGLTAFYTSKVNKKAKQREEQAAKELDKQKEYLIKVTEMLKEEYDSEVAKIVSRFNEERNNFNLQIEEQRNQLNALTDECNSLKRLLEDQNCKFERIQKLYPDCDFEAEIQKMIESEYKDAASELDAKLAETLLLNADKNHIDDFKLAINSFEVASSDVKKYITSDIQRLHDLYEESISLQMEYERAEQEKRDRAKAESVCKEIKRIYDRNPDGNYENYNALKKAYNMYCSLSSVQKQYFEDRELLDSLTESLKEAEQDYNDWQAAHNAEEKINSIINRIHYADENDCDNLDRAMRIYRNLTVLQVSYFNDETLYRLKHLIRDAEDDRRRQEERRRQERMNHDRNLSHNNNISRPNSGPSNRTSNTNSSRTSYGRSSRTSNTNVSRPSASRSTHSNTGRGGRSSGGGATRKF